MLNSKFSDLPVPPLQRRKVNGAAPMCKHSPTVIISLLMQKGEGNRKEFLRKMIITHNTQFICNYQTLQAG